MSKTSCDELNVYDEYTFTLPQNEGDTYDDVCPPTTYFCPKGGAYECQQSLPNDPFADPTRRQYFDDLACSFDACNANCDNPLPNGQICFQCGIGLGPACDEDTCTNLRPYCVYEPDQQLVVRIFNGTVIGDLIDWVKGRHSCYPDPGLCLQEELTVPCKIGGVCELRKESQCPKENIVAPQDAACAKLIPPQ